MCHFELDGGVTISQLVLDDTEELFALVEKNRTYLRQWLNFLDDTKAPQDTRKFIESMNDLHRKTRACTCAIRVHGEIVGVVSHYYIDWENRYAHLGYWLSEEWQGRGIMTRVCAAFVEHAFQVLSLNIVELSCAAENLRSQRIPERLGFKEEGTYREIEWLYDRFLDHKVFSILCSEWKQTAGGD